MPRIPIMQLTAYEAAIKNSSGQLITDAFPAIASGWSSKIWLNPSNRYYNFKKLDSDIKASSIISNDIIDYIASSVIFHSSDGWSYFGRAINSLLNGDHESARHLLYYSELRAAMSLLAYNGIGVFNSRHIAVNSTGSITGLFNVEYRDTRNRVQRYNTGTHAFVWDAFRLLVPNQLSATFLKCISPQNTALDQFLPNSTASKNKIIQSLLNKIGLDYKLFADDHISRNHSSYRPTFINEIISPDAAKVSHTVKQIFQNSRPTEIAPFDGIDKLILHYTMRESAKVQGNKNFNAFISAFEADRANPSLSENLITYLKSPLSSDNLLALAKSGNSLLDGNYTIEMMCRAFVLLRFSTGVCKNLFSSLSPGQLLGVKSYLEYLIVKRGVQAAGNIIDPLTDLWVEIEILEEDFSNQLSTLSPQTFFHFTDKIPDLSFRVGKFETIGLLGSQL